MSSAERLPAGAQWLAGPPPRASRFGEPARFREGLYRISPRCLAWMVPNGSWGETNIGLVEAEGASALVDTCWDLNYTQEMLAACAPVLERAPVELVVNTHADGDHCWGNQLFPGRPIHATHACIHQMHHMNPRALQALKLGGRVLRHLPLAGLDRFGHYMSGMFAPYDFAPVRITSPDQGFSGERVLDLRGLQLRLIEVGPGHTDGDAIVHVPDERVAYAGDILFTGVTPVMWAGPVESLVAGLKRLQALDVDIIVPGHGPLAAPADVQDVIDYWDHAQEALHRCLLQGMAPDAAARSVVLGAEFRRRPWAAWDSPERMVTNAYTLYRHWGARLPSLPGQLGVMDLMRRQAALAFALPQATPRGMHAF
ncbi:MAG: MBL fold metallo-hydrolase [Aquabacterium sp.]|jgi:cyclase|nr:MAG: MBL fold metallo-hydrolase [Aquabacterium sp.]